MLWGILSQGNFSLEDFVTGDYVVRDLVKGDFCHGGVFVVDSYKEFRPEALTTVPQNVIKLDSWITGCYEI